MIPQSKVEEVRALLRARNLSRRRIAIITGVGRSTISAIASGKRPDFVVAERVQICDFGPVVWCTGCGHNVELVDGECLLCVRQGNPRRYLPSRNGRPRRAESGTRHRIFPRK
jgi:hypothetical protein